MNQFQPLDLDEPPTKHKWSLRTTVLTIIFSLAAITGIMVGAVEGSKPARYPNYRPLDYRLVDTYAGSSFFDMFDYFTESDPTGGFVRYVNASTALTQNLTTTTTTTTPNRALLRVDDQTAYTPTGRASIRLESKARYDNGLFIFDIMHTPHGCGTWPALWLTDGYNWPVNGEIDVLEAVNNGTDGNAVTLHTSPGCHMGGVKRVQTGEVVHAACGNSSDGGVGCGVRGGPGTFGREMNMGGGGIYALDLRPEGIRAWFFPRASMPPDLGIADRNIPPDPSTWGQPLADFPNTECDIMGHFRNLSIIVNIDLCGEWAGKREVYTEQFSCPGTCEEFVAGNPGAFREAFWEFGGFWVYQV
ncbi:concanavalin A-like lectin/glucanase domain-containing protein [Aspergillus californicus]